MDYGHGMAQQAQFKANACDELKDCPTESGLFRIAAQIGEAEERINRLASQLSELSRGIHGPRPEPVSEKCAQGGATNADCLASRANMLMAALLRLENSYMSVVR